MALNWNIPVGHYKSPSFGFSKIWCSVKNVKCIGLMTFSICQIEKGLYTLAFYSLNWSQICLEMS